MNWFDAAGFANLAKTALNTAQKTIDKALDIQEEKARASGKKVDKKEETDSFFEAYGLTEKADEKSKPPPKQSPPPQPTTSGKNEPLQGSGFWGDTWSSFFEMKPQTLPKADASAESATKDSSLKDKNRKEDAVLSQPHRASPFPGNVVSKECSNPEPSISQIKQDENQKASHDEIKDNQIEAVTETQSFQQDIIIKDSDADKPQSRVEPICDKLEDKTHVEDEKPPNLSSEEQFLSVDLPNATNQMPQSQYDVIEINEDKTSVSLSSSLTESASVEVIASEQNSMYLTQSTLEIPDLTPSVIANWEWGARDKPTHSDKKSEAVVATMDSSFHNITLTDLEENYKSSHFNDESQNSSNEERNSHHSDGSSNSSKDDDDTDTAEAKDFDAKSSSSRVSAASSGSFVKCSAEETENGSHRGQSPSEKSDVAIEKSEQNTSGDENETATSSDIEILSPPNGENGDRNPSPLKHVWLPRPLKLRRSESPTSDSSKESSMPVVSELDEVEYTIQDNSVTVHYFDKGRKIVCEASDSNVDETLSSLLQKQEELQNMLQAREQRIEELSKENAELQEDEQRLKKLVQKMREEQIKESRDITALTKEFTQRLSQVENQLKQVTKDRDILKTKFDEAEKEIARRISAADIEEVIKEKDQQIKELTEEGQKLSKKELQHTTIIKKLRAKEDEMDKTIKSQADRLEENTKEVERLRKSISAKEEQEKKHIDAIRQLTNTIKKHEKEIASLKSSLEDSKEKELSLKRSLDGTYKDLTELQISYSTKEKELEDLKSGLELEAKENLRHSLENANKESMREKEMLLMEMQELRCTLTRTEEEANLREKMFKADFASLQKRLQEAEERNEELTKNMSSATRPLVRQIENLQATYNTQIASWEKIEKNLTDRLSDAQSQLALASERERAATEKYLEYHSKVTAYESQNSTLRQERLQLSSELEALKTKIVVLEENKSRETYALDSMKQTLNSEITKLINDKENLENMVNNYMDQLEKERKKVLKLEEEIRLKDTRLSNISPCPSPTGSMRSSIGSLHNWSQDEIPEKGMSTPVNNYRMSVYDSLRLGSGSSLIESLQSQLKQREGEIIQLQSEISKLENIKESVTKELVEISEQNEELESKLNKLEAVEKEYKELDQKYNTLLQMYGEKVEETEELYLDLDDVKSMYKAQIEELLRNQ